jgi:hypothetical protein
MESDSIKKVNAFFRNQLKSDLEADRRHCNQNYNICRTPN